MLYMQFNFVNVNLSIVANNFYNVFLYRLLILRGGFTLNYASVGDFKFSYMERGKGRGVENVVLMVHGFTGDKGVWSLVGNVFLKHIIL